MTLRNRLYMSFGAVLAMVLVMFAVNWRAVSREHEAKKAAQTSLDLKDATDAVKFQMMQNRLYLSNYLLSGDTREVDRMNDGLRTLNEKLERAKTLAESEQEKTALEKVQQLEQNWAKEFGQPLVDKRKDVDSGNATVAELQIFYLQKDASTWVKNSTEALEVADHENRNTLDLRKESNEAAAAYTKTFSIGATFVALIVGFFVAIHTARSITGPITQLMAVAHNIGNNGDLEHNIEVDTKRQDEIGELGRTFAKMVIYFKEMATVSEAIASGDLAVEVEPRSKRDTLGNAFQQMVRSLRNLVRSVRDLASQVASASNQVAGASDESAKVSLQAFRLSTKSPAPCTR